MNYFLYNCWIHHFTMFDRNWFCITVQTSLLVILRICHLSGETQHLLYVVYSVSRLLLYLHTPPVITKAYIIRLVLQIRIQKTCLISQQLVPECPCSPRWCPWELAGLMCLGHRSPWHHALGSPLFSQPSWGTLSLPFFQGSVTLDCPNIKLHSRLVLSQAIFLSCLFSS